jgi:V8-like Glu-specific endopeptidase
VPTKKTGNPRAVKGSYHSIRPSTPEEYLKLDNGPAMESMPQEILKAATTRLVTVHTLGNDFAPRIVKLSETPGTWEFALPTGAGLLQPGRKTARLSVDAIKRGIKATANGEPFRPAWLDYTPHPKLSTATQPLLRRINGRMIKPHYGVFGADDRVIYYPSGYPWTCIGRVFVWEDSSKPSWSKSGSAVLIGSRVILTAGHVVPWQSSNWAMQFVPAYYDGVSVLGSGVSSWVSNCHGYDTSNNVSAWDMAVCRLYTPLGNSYGYFGAKTYSSSWEGGNYWTLAGYPAALASGRRPSRQMWFPIVDDDSDGSAKELEYYADQTGGDSGGPVFGFWSGLPYAVGTASGGEKSTFLWWTIEDDNVAAGGAALVDLVGWARSNWP